ncbi:SPOR domain-containing protein [Loktanella sp. M215]|uniref:SPOR domain-containing protein n=1 Tax=Loktanella sp. M215 TaxID=2675431 RepID=UPI001F48E040|nr:SPOR domain-containing protein [Loktanella sp. M215]MCF7701051.1 hypothetical protein [Loktanella sp. M215]
MSATRFASAIATAALMASGLGVASAAAQTSAVPAEFPPAGYDASQYVDSKGCAFVRAGMDGMVSWVPRVDRARNQLCNFQPTITRTAQAPAPAPTSAPTPAPVPTPPRVTLPARTAPAAVAPPPRVAMATPQVRRVPAPQPARVAAAAPRTVPAPQAAPAPRITYAQACAGRFGVQPGFISASTRAPIDCGPGPQAVTAPTQLRLTLDAACARQAQTGQTLINAATGAPIACATQAPVQIAAAAPGAYTLPATGQAAPGCNIPGLIWDPRFPVRCGPQTESPSGRVYGLSRGYRVIAEVTARYPAAAVAPRATPARSAPPLFGAGPVPASNAPYGGPVQTPAGYARVWDDGRINPLRGKQVVQATPYVSSRSVAPAAVRAPAAVLAPAAAAGQRYVQVGSFGDPANAARLIARLQAAGLPVASARSGGQKTIAAGPFRSSGDLNHALGIVRGMGFSDAFLRS